MANLKSILGKLFVNDNEIMTEANIDNTDYGIIYGGTTANGYVKYPDGTLICHFRDSPATAATVYTYPHAFVGTPVVTTSASSSSLALMMTATTTDIAVTVYRWKHDGTASALTYGLNIIAIGRWK